MPNTTIKDDATRSDGRKVEEVGTNHHGLAVVAIPG